MKRNLPLALIAACLIVPAAARAAAPEPPKEGWETSLNAGLTINQGNTENMLINGSLASQYKQGQNDLRLGAEESYGETDDSVTTRNGKAFGNYKRLLGDRLSAYLDATAVYDEIADIDYRVTVGPGLGYYLIKTEETGLSVDIGPSYIFEDVAGKTDDYLALRFAERLEWKNGKVAKVWESVEYLPTAEDWSDYLLNAEVGAEAALNSTINLRLVVQDRYDSTPAPDREDNDVVIIAGLGVKL